MEDGMREKVIFTLLVVWVTIFFSLLTTPALADHGVFHGKVVGTEFTVIQVRGHDGKVSVFWMGHKAHFDSRVPFFGDILILQISVIHGPIFRGLLPRLSKNPSV
jgi:hypothetical protein